MGNIIQNFSLLSKYAHWKNHTNQSIQKMSWDAVVRIQVAKHWRLHTYVVLTFIPDVVHLNTPISLDFPSIAHLPSLSPHPSGIAVSGAFSRPRGCSIRRPAEQVRPSGYSTEDDARSGTKETTTSQHTLKCIFTLIPLERLAAPAWDWMKLMKGIIRKKRNSKTDPL